VPFDVQYPLTVVFPPASWKIAKEFALLITPPFIINDPPTWLRNVPPPVPVASVKPVKFNVPELVFTTE
jgi:hypothetical protein